MSGLSDLVVADPVDARKVALALHPAQAFDGIDIKNVDTVKFVTLHELVSGRSFEELLAAHEPSIAVANR